MAQTVKHLSTTPETRVQALGWDIVFHPRSKHVLILWLQSPSAVILEPPKIKYLTVYTVFPFICHEVMGPDAMIFVF